MTGQILEQNVCVQSVKITNPGQEDCELCVMGQRRQARLKGRRIRIGVGAGAMNTGNQYVT